MLQAIALGQSAPDRATRIRMASHPKIQEKKYRAALRAAEIAATRLQKRQ